MFFALPTSFVLILALQASNALASPFLAPRNASITSTTQQTNDLGPGASCITGGDCARANPQTLGVLYYAAMGTLQRDQVYANGAALACTNENICVVVTRDGGQHGLSIQMSLAGLVANGCHACGYVGNSVAVNRVSFAPACPGPKWTHADQFDTARGGFVCY